MAPPNMWDRPTNIPFPAERMAETLALQIRMSEFTKAHDAATINPAVAAAATHAGLVTAAGLDALGLPEILVLTEAEKTRRRVLYPWLPRY